MYSPRTGDGRASVPPNARDLSSSMLSDHVLERPYRERLVKRDWSLDRLSVRREPSVNSSSSLPTSSKRYSLGRHGENGRFGSPGDSLFQETGASYRRSERDFSYGAASHATRDYPDSWETNTSSGENKDGSYLTEHCCRHLDPSDSKMKGTNAVGWDSSFKEEREIKDRAHFKQDFRRRVSHFDSAYDWDNKGGGRLDRYGVGHRESLMVDSLADGKDLPSYDRVSSLPSTLSIRRSPQSSPRSFPFTSANDSPAAGVCSPAKTRPRLGWGQGLAKYEKKKVEVDNGQNVSSNGTGPSNAAGNDDRCPLNEGKSSPPSSSLKNARTLTSPETNNDCPEEVAPEAEQVQENLEKPLSPERDHTSGSIEIPTKEQEVVSSQAAVSLPIQSGTSLTKEAILLEVEKVESEIDSIEREIAAFCADSEEDVTISSIEGVGKTADSDSVGRQQQSPSRVPESCLEVPSQAADGFVNTNLESSDMQAVLHLQKERTLGFVVNVLEENQRKAKLGAQSFAHLLPRGTDYIAGETYSQAPAWHANREAFNKQKARMQQKISDLNCLLRMKERILVMKCQALKEFWKQEQLGIGQKREKTLRNGFNSSIRLRPMCGGSLKFHEEVQIKTIPSEAVAGRARGSLKMPAMILGDKEKFFRKFITNNGLVEDPIALEQERKLINPWTPEEKKIFLEKFAVFNKIFSKIASYLEHKTTAECVEFYYRNHKSEEFDKIRKKQQLKKRRDYSRGSASYLATTTPTSRHREAAVARLQEQNLTFSSGSARDAMRFTKTVTQKVGERGRPGFCAEYGRSELLTAGKSSSKENKAANGLLAVAGMLTSSTAGSCPAARSCYGKHSSKDHGGSETEQVAGPKGVYGRRDSAEEVDSQWTDRERLLFTDAVGLYGKDFKSIAQHVGSKSVGQCKAFFSKTRKRFGLDKIVQQLQNASQSTLELEAKPALEIETPEVCAELKAEPCELSYSDLKGSSCSQEKTQNTSGVGSRLDEIQVDEPTDVRNSCVVTCSSSHQLAVVDENVGEAVKDVIQVAHGRELKIENTGGLAKGMKVDEKGHRELEENTVSEIKTESFVKEEPGTRTYIGKPVVAPTTEEDGQKESKRLKMDPDLFMASAVSAEVNNGHPLPAMAATTNTGSNVQGREKVAKINSAGEPKPRREPTSWTQEEKEIFAEIIKKHGKDWKLLRESLPSKSLTQIKTYFQNSKAKLGFTSADGVGTCARGANARKRKAEDLDISSTSGTSYVGAENLAYALFGQNAGQAVEGTACIADVQKFLRQMCANGYAPQTASSTAPSPLFTAGSLPILPLSSSSLQQPFSQSSKQPHGTVSRSQQALSSQVIQQQQQQQLAMPPMVAHKPKLANQLQQQQAAAQVASLTQKHLQTEVAHHVQQQIAHHQQQQVQQLQQQALSQLHHQASKVVIQQQQLQQALQQQSAGACQLHQQILVQQQQPSHQAIQQLNQQQHLLSQHSIISQQKAEQQSIMQQQAQSLLQQKHLLVQQQKALQPQVLCHPNELLHQQQLQAALQKQEEILSKLKQQSSLLLAQDRQQLGKQVSENPYFMVQSEQAPNHQQIISQQQQQFLQGMHVHFSQQQESSLGKPLHSLQASRSGPELSKCDSAKKVLEELHAPQAASELSKVEVAESQSNRGPDVKLFGQSLLSQPTGPLASVKTCSTPGAKLPFHQECSSLALPVSSICTATSSITKEPSACRTGVPFLLADGSWSSVPSTTIGGHQTAVTKPGDEHIVHEAVAQMAIGLAQREPVILSNRPDDQQRVMQGCFRNEAVVNGVVTGKSQSDQLNGSLERITVGTEREPLLARATGQSFGLPLASMQGTQALSSQGLSCAVMDAIMTIAGWQNPHAGNSQGDVHRGLDNVVNASTGSGLPGRTVPYNQSHLCGPDILQHIRESLYLPPSQLLNLSGHTGINSSAWATTGGLATASDLQRVLASQVATFQTRNPATVEDIGRPDDMRELNDGGKAG